jgi:hypothetical protein
MNKIQVSTVALMAQWLSRGNALRSDDHYVTGSNPCVISYVGAGLSDETVCKPMSRVAADVTRKRAFTAKIITLSTVMSVQFTNIVQNLSFKLRVHVYVRFILISQVLT